MQGEVQAKSDSPKVIVVELSSIFIYPSVDYIKDKIITMAKTGSSSTTILKLVVQYCTQVADFTTNQSVPTLLVISIGEHN